MLLLVLAEPPTWTRIKAVSRRHCSSGEALIVGGDIRGGFRSSPMFWFPAAEEQSQSGPLGVCFGLMSFRCWAARAAVSHAHLARLLASSVMLRASAHRHPRRSSHCLIHRISSVSLRHRQPPLLLVSFLYRACFLTSVCRVINPEYRDQSDGRRSVGFWDTGESGVSSIPCRHAAVGAAYRCFFGWWRLMSYLEPLWGRGLSTECNTQRQTSLAASLARRYDPSAVSYPSSV